MDLIEIAYNIKDCAHNVPLIYEGDEDRRIDVAEFALAMSVELFTSRRL
jgi:hypothetical protein